jgi:hypothetical protein
MNARDIGIYILLYPFLFAVGFLNGALRELTYSRYLGEYQKQAVGTFTGIVLVGIAIYIINYLRPFRSKARALMVGAVWAVLTVVFEAVMILVFIKEDVNTVLNAYDLSKGQLWPFVLVFVTVFPVIIAGKGE